MLDRFDDFLRSLIHLELPLGKTKLTLLDALLAVGISFAAVFIRVPVFHYIQLTGTAFTMKCIYCGLDLLMAALMAFYVYRISDSKLKTLGIYSVTVIWPVFAANSALNGGFEVRNAVVLLAVLCVLAIWKKYTKTAFMLFVLLVSILQITQGDIPVERLTNHWPNIYLLIDDVELLREYRMSGKLFVIGSLMMIFYYFSKKKLTVTPKLLVSTGLFTSLFICYFYPFMNYRSGYLPNVFAILLFFCDKKKFYQPLLLCIVSYVAYSYYYAGEEVGLAFWIYAIVLLVLLFDAGMYVYGQLSEGTKG